MPSLKGKKYASSGSLEKTFMSSVIFLVTSLCNVLAFF